MTPHWTQSTHHLVAGVLLAMLTTWIAQRWCPLWLAAILGFSLTCAAELVIELLEWRILYHRASGSRIYFDTIADLAMTALGGTLGGSFAAAVAAWRARARGLGGGG